LKNAPKPTPGQTGPRRPHPAICYQSIGRLADLAGTTNRNPCSAELPPASILDFALTTRLSEKRLADTWSWGVLRLPSGQCCSACTTFGPKGLLLLEVLKGVDLTPAEQRSLARAFVAGHVREQARQSRRGVGVGTGGTV
jgi:hypothetical protein